MLPILILLLTLFAYPFICQARDGPDTPFQVQSREKEGLLVAEVTGVIEFPFDQVSEALTAPEAWCEFIPLIFNVKACTYLRQDERAALTFYIAQRFHDPLPQAIRMQYDFEVREDERDLSRIHLFARRGPHGTRDYTIDLEVRPADEGQTELRLHSSFRPSFRSRLATWAYLAGPGRDKVGFSLERYVGGRRVYVRGEEGIIERNAMRHFLALEAFLETMHLPEEERFEASLHAWFEATERYPRQLREMEREEYLAAKKRERQIQEKVQERIGSGLGAWAEPDP